MPREAFHKFPEFECLEIHLATQFQNIVYEYLPIPLKEKIYEWLKENCINEKKEDQTEQQFIYKTRKKALGPFKKEIHSIARDLKERASGVLEEEFDFLFDQLKVKDTKPIVDKVVTAVEIHKRKKDFLKAEPDLGGFEGAD